MSTHTHTHRKTLMEAWKKEDERIKGENPVWGEARSRALHAHIHTYVYVYINIYTYIYIYVYIYI